MKVLIISIGTRGDMEPFLAIGALLKQCGHEVIAAFPNQFRKLAQDTDISFHSLGPKFIELLDSEDGQIAMGGKFGLKKLRSIYSLATKHQHVQKILVQKQQQIVEEVKPDFIIHHAKAMYPLIWEVLNPNRTVLISPVPYLHYVKNHSHLAFNRNFGPFLNKLTYQLADWGLIKLAGKALKMLDIKVVKKAQIKKALYEHKVIYTVSPQLFVRPKEWAPHLKVLGYHERRKTTHWKPGDELKDFLQRHKKILFITFGSMSNLDPEGNTHLLVDLVTKHQIPSIINTAAGGLIKPKNWDHNLLYFVSNIPYDWIFERVYAVIHHGGSGTTHTALKYGCATMIIPHIIDQFIWNKIVTSKGCGPLGIPISKLSERRIERKLLSLWENKAYKMQAKKISEAMKSEDFEKQLIFELTRMR
ncbi:MAG: nucleotide disphospho-sugar-binding domain-containing protein [Bacteroidota bacterium]